MATITRTARENQYDYVGNASTWTIVVTDNNTLNVTTVGETITLNAPTLTAQYAPPSTSGTKNRGSVSLSVVYDLYSYGLGYASFQKTRASGAMSPNVTYTIATNGTSSYSKDASKLFTSNNPTEKSIAIPYSFDGVWLESWGTPGQSYWGALNNLSGGTGINYIYYKCPPVLGTCSLSKNTSDYFAGLTRVTFNVPITYSASGTTGTAKYGGYIKKIEVAIGSQTKAVTFDESTKPTSAQTLFIDLSSAGTFTPTITVTDSRDQTATQTLSDITVLPYNVPSATFDVYRTNDVGIKNDEGHYALIQTTINYTDAIATLIEPSIQIDGVDLSSLTDASVTWYKTWSNTNGVSNVISDWTTLVPQNHMVTIYGLIDWDYDTTGNFAEDTSYQITLVANDSVDGHSTPITQTMSTAFYTIDFKAGGKEIAFGSPANDTLTPTQEDIGLFKCAMDTAFNDMTSQEVEDFVDSISGTGADIIDILSPCYMELRLTANTVMSISSAWTYVKIPLDRIERSYGTGLTFTSNSIQIDKAGYYMISASAVGSQPNYIQLRLNSTLISQNISNEATWEGYGFGSYVIKCNAGDTVSLWITKTTNTNPSVAGAPATNLTVTKVPWIV